jgi:hypothetical protein
LESPLPDVIEESKRVLAAASDSGVTLRLVGGVAVRVSSPSSTKEPLKRGYRDADFVAKGNETKKLRELFTGLGYLPRETFNAMQGGRRMVFNDMGNQRRVDIFQDYFEMCHKFDLRKRLALRPDTLPMADLMETKLQIVQMNEKDYRDVLALLIDHDLGDDDVGDRINSSHVVGLCASDWGIYRTFTGSLEKVIGNLDRYQLDGADRRTAEGRAQKLLEDIEAAPKSLKWKVRAQVGERVPWYDTPEADVAVVDSRF